MKLSALLLTAALCAAAAPLAAQGPPTPAPAVDTAATTSQPTQLRGPRASEPLRTVPASYREAGSPAPMRDRTITMSTLSLVLIIVIVVLLVS